MSNYIRKFKRNSYKLADLAIQRILSEERYLNKLRQVSRIIPCPFDHKPCNKSSCKDCTPYEKNRWKNDLVLYDIESKSNYRKDEFEKKRLNISPKKERSKKWI